MAHDHVANQLCADKLANARSRLGGVVGNYREFSLSLADDLIH